MYAVRFRFFPIFVMRDSDSVERHLFMTLSFLSHVLNAHIAITHILFLGKTITEFLQQDFAALSNNVKSSNLMSLLHAFPISPYIQNKTLNSCITRKRNQSKTFGRNALCDKFQRVTLLSMLATKPFQIMFCCTTRNSIFQRSCR